MIYKWCNYCGNRFMQVKFESYHGSTDTYECFCRRCGYKDSVSHKEVMLGGSERYTPGPTEDTLSLWRNLYPRHF